MRIVNKVSELEATRLRPSEQLRPTDLNRSVRATIIMDGDWLAEGLTRFKSQDPKRRIWRRLRSALAIFFVVIGLAATILKQSPFPLLALGGLALLFYIIHKLDIYLIKTRLRSSPHWNDRIEVTLSEDGYGTVSPLHEAKLAWKLFTGAVAFADGVLVLQGKDSYNWLPFRCLENQADAELLYSYVTERIAASKQSDPVGGRPENPQAFSLRRLPQARRARFWNDESAKSLGTGRSSRSLFSRRSKAMTGGWSRWFAVILAINLACGCVGSSQPGGAASETVLRGELIRKEWSKSDESFNAGGSEYYVLKVPESLVPANRRTAKEGVVLLSSAAVSFGRFDELVGKEVECRGEFVDGKKFQPPQDSVEQFPVGGVTEQAGEKMDVTVGAGFAVNSIEPIAKK